MTAPKPSTRDAARRRAQTPPAIAKVSPNTLESAVLRALAQAGRTGTRVARSEIVRLRPSGTVDRRIKIDYLPDPDHAASVLMRLTPASAAALPAASTPMDLLSTQQAAEMLHVSRPYVTKLADGGVFHDVVRTAAGHRRIPRVEVDRVLAEMKLARRDALGQVEALAGDQLDEALADARKHARVRWVRGG